MPKPFVILVPQIMLGNNPFTTSAKPDTVNLTSTTDVLWLNSTLKEGRVLLFPKGYVPETKENKYVKSPFAGHQLKTKNFAANERRPGEGWVFLALLLIAVLLVWLRRINPKKLSVYLSAIYNRRSLNEIFEEEHILSSSYSLILFFTFCLTLALFIVKMLVVLQLGVVEQYGAFMAFGILAAAIFIIYAVKILFVQFMGNVFGIYPVAKQYAFNVYLLNNILGLLLVPVVAIAYYSGAPADTWAVYTGIALFALFFVLRFLKSLSIEGIISPVNLLYLFLYLCTLEILPLLVATKLAIIYM